MLTTQQSTVQMLFLFLCASAAPRAAFAPAAGCCLRGGKSGVGAYSLYTAFTDSNRPPHARDAALSSSSWSSVRDTRLFATKKKKKSKSKPSKKSGFEWASTFMLKPFESQASRELVTEAVASFQGRTGKPLCNEVVGVDDIPKALWKASTACIILQKNQDDDGSVRVPFANLAALETIGLRQDQWEQLVDTSNGIVNNSNGEKEADETTNTKIRLDLPVNMPSDKAYQSGYTKKILRAHDTETNNPLQQDIKIEKAHRWKLEKTALVDGKFVTTPVGIAYCWEEWSLNDAILCSTGGQQREKINVEQVQDAVEKQAVLVRSLKEEQGMTNQDPEVKNAVQELLRLKELLEIA